MINPTPQTQYIHILKRPVRQLIIPPIFHPRDLLALGKDLHFTRDRMFRAQPLDLVHGLEVDLDRVAGASDGGREPLNLGEGCLQTVPLRRVLLTAFGDGERFGKGCVVGPDGRFFDGGAAGEELEFVVVLVSSHNRAFCESHDCKAVKDRFSHQARFL
jgi:hypothetical protein